MEERRKDYLNITERLAIIEQVLIDNKRLYEEENKTRSEWRNGICKKQDITIKQQGMILEHLDRIDTRCEGRLPGCIAVRQDVEEMKKEKIYKKNRNFKVGMAIFVALLALITGLFNAFLNKIQLGKINKLNAEIKQNEADNGR
jgi:hypothetical protein